VPGVTPELLYGEARASEEAAAPAREPRAGGRGLSRREPESADEEAPAASAIEADPVALIDLLTVYSFDPNVIAGLGSWKGTGASCG
jgi:hypothetical protein